MARAVTRKFAALPLLGAAGFSALLIAGCTRVGDTAVSGPFPQVGDAAAAASPPTTLPAGMSISTSRPPPDGAAADLLARTAAGETVAVPGPPPGPVPGAAERPPMPSPAQEMLRMVEDLRRGQGLPPLAVDERLVAAARQQALAMSEAGELAHQNLVDDLDLGWTVVGENVGYGPNGPAIFDALVNSEGHYANLVLSRYTHVGIAVVTDPRGRLWVSQVFGG